MWHLNYSSSSLSHKFVLSQALAHESWLTSMVVCLHLPLQSLSPISLPRASLSPLSVLPNADVVAPPRASPLNIPICLSSLDDPTVGDGHPAPSCQISPDARAQPTTSSTPSFYFACIVRGKGSS